MCGEKLPQAGHFKAASLVDATVGSGAYRVIRVLGTGSMGVVYEAEQLALGRRVALKVIGETSDDETSRARFRREARAASQLNHPNVVQIIDFGRLRGGQPYLAMELLNGRTLEEVIDEDFPLDLSRTIQLTCDVLSALEAAHNLGILHRDLKPANVFLSQLPGDREVAKVLDFGVATAMDSTLTESKTWAPLTEAGFVCGTPAFMSPEQVQGFSLDQRSDLFSAGALLYMTITGERPFPGKTPVEVGANIVLKGLMPASRARPDLKLPAELDQFLKVAMAKKVEDRFASAREMRRRLEATFEEIEKRLANEPEQVPDLPRPVSQTPVAQAVLMETADTVVDMPALAEPDGKVNHRSETEIIPSNPSQPPPPIHPPVAPVELESRPDYSTLDTGAIPSNRPISSIIWTAIAAIAIVALIIYIAILVAT